MFLQTGNLTQNTAISGTSFLQPQQKLTRDKLIEYGLTS